MAVLKVIVKRPGFGASTDGRGTTAYDMAGVYTAQAVIDPRETRDCLIRLLEVHEMRRSGGVGEHLMRTWPTTH